MITCIAIDDEPLALKQIAGYIEKTKALNLIGRFESALKAIDFVQENHVDLMFVDINMPDLTGLDFVKSLNNPPKVIFTTAYSEYAIDGFRVNAIDYLLKPIGYKDFLLSVDKAKTWFAKDLLKPEQINTKNDSLFIKSEYKIIRIKLNEIKYIEGMREYVQIHTINNPPVMTLLSMKKIEKYLPSESFMRVHRSFIVNLKQVTTIERNRIVFDENVYIPVSDQYKDTFRKYIDKHFL
jgi:two-component system, LytTR family, response regulator